VPHPVIDQCRTPYYRPPTTVAHTVNTAYEAILPLSQARETGMHGTDSPWTLH